MSYVTISKEHYEKLVHYVDLEEQLEKLYSDRLTLDDVVNNLNRIVQNGEEKLDFARILTNAEAEKWDKWKDLEEQGRLINEEDVLKFYYIDSEDKYVVGQRLDTMYYAEITERFSLAFYMSRYLPWGEHVVDEKSAWKEHTYCSEPREIPFTEWLKGFMEQRAKMDEVKE